jgi:putative proteasome-type protease
MTYCVGLKLKAGLVLLSDTRTNAGVDNIARFRKQFVFEEPGERVVALMTAGNLGITQGVVTHITTQIKQSRIDPEIESLMTCDTLYRGAQMVGEAMREVQKRDRAEIEAQGAAADATVIMAGQRKGGELRLFLIYTAGNFIEAGDDTPYLQIGEHKYGKPILDRVIRPDTTIEEAVKAALVSMDSTVRSNLSVGMPLDMCVIPVNEFKAKSQRIESDHPEFRQISDSWAASLRTAFNALPAVKI